MSREAPAFTAGWSQRLGTMVEQLRNETISFVLPVLGLAALALLGHIPAYEGNPVRLGALSLLLAAVGLLVGRLRHTSYVLAAWTLVSGTAVAILLLVAWVGLTPILPLLAVPAGLTMLLVTRKAGITVAAVGSLLVLLAPPGFLPVAPAARLGVIILLWSVAGLIALAVRPLVTTTQWAWAEYERSQQLLEEARAYQVQLHEALQDLTAANTQLTRLNVQTDALRQVAEDARRAKEQFVSNVSHELRTPLNMIIGFAEMMVQFPQTYGEALPPALLADLDVVLRNSRHLADLVDDVLDLSQIEAGHMALTKEWVRLAEIIEAAVVAVRPLYESKGLYLQTDIAADLPAVFCDRTRIREVLLNLLSNAGRFTQQGGVRVRMWREGETVLVSVTDTGPGISDADQNRIFQPFQQVDGSIRRKFGGTGLGLSISKSFIELHEGKLWLASAPGQGSTFTFRLPISPPVEVESSGVRWINPYQTYEPRTRPARLPTPSIQPRVIVIETGQALQRLVSRYGGPLEVVHAADLAAAGVELEHAPAQALMINHLQPAEMIEKVNQWGGLPYGVPVFVAALPETAAGVGRDGVVAYLVKPVSRAQLLAALQDLHREIHTVLVVDDDEAALQLFRRMLASMDDRYRVLRASDGRQALAMLRRSRPDVILLDLVMPEMDGFAFLAARNSEPAWRDIPVILLSAQDPFGQPIMSSGLAVTCKDGLSAQQLLASFNALKQILGLGPERGPVPDDPAPRAGPRV